MTTATTNTAPKGKGMNGSTKYIAIIGILATVIIALFARQIEWESVESDLIHHTQEPAHGVVGNRLRSLEHTDIRFEARLARIEEKIDAIVTATGAVVP